jgi:hypothetical protein
MPEAGPSVSSLAFTRLDETGACGAFLNLLIHSRLPLSHLSTGPQILTTWRKDPWSCFISRLGRTRTRRERRRASGAQPSGPPGMAAAATPAPFVANRNSDLYHRTDCNGPQDYKRDHLVQFALAGRGGVRNFWLAGTAASGSLGAGRWLHGLEDGVRLSGYR